MTPQVETSRRRGPAAWGRRLALLGVLGAGSLGPEPVVAESDQGSAAAETPRAELSALIDDARIPGLAAAVTRGGAVVWSGGFGFADLDSQRPFTPDTILNVGSVSKTVTAAAVLRLWEKGVLDLDADINTTLPFSVRHPSFPDRPITLRQLLTHTAGFADGSAYEESYACGDPAVSLSDWLEAYLTPDGKWYDPDANFLETGPGEAFDYSNVGIGVAGLVAEVAAGVPFAELTRREVLVPLGMDSSGWYLSEVDLTRHAVPYELVTPEEPVEVPSLIAGRLPTSDEPTLVPDCLYSFYNLPDGLLRSTVDDLARLLLGHQPGAPPGTPRLLSNETLELALSDRLGDDVATDGRIQGLVWRGLDLKGLGRLWGHGGADPGIRAQMLWRPADDVGVVVLTNRLVVGELKPILERLFAIGESIEPPAPR